MGAKTPDPSNLLDPLEKREVLYTSDSSAELLVGWGEAFREAGYLMDALDFFAQARSEAHLEPLRNEALERGDLFLYQRCMKALGREPDPKELEALATHARNHGLDQFARRARGEETAMPEGKEATETTG